MFPVGSYSVFIDKIRRREDIEIPITIGILIADLRQQKCAEYVINYMNRFNDLSAKYIDFYIPGYIENDDFNSEANMKICEKIYTFDYYYFYKFRSKLEEDFNIPFTYNPRLILIEYNKGHFRFSRKIIIDLDIDGSDIERTGEVFNIAKMKLMYLAFLQIFQIIIFEEASMILSLK